MSCRCRILPRGFLPGGCTIASFLVAWLGVFGLKFGLWERVLVYGLTISVSGE